MKRFSRKWFSQIMINNKLKQKLDYLKEIIRMETNSPYKLSYGDVVKHLIQKYEESKRLEYPIREEITVVTPLKAKNLNVSIPLSKTSSISSSKLDGKRNVSFSLET